MKGQIEGQMNIFDFIKPRAENMPMKDYLTMQGFKNEYYEVPDHECIVEVADIHEYPKLHIYKARYHTNKFGYICQIYPKNCGYSCPWWREIIPEMPMGLDFFKDGWHLMEEGFDGIGKDTPLEVLGKYKMNGKEHWSQCPAYYDDKNIHPMEVPWDIPRPKFIYWRIKPQKICNFSGHSCNKKELWEIADSLDELQCPHVCCRQCNTRNCGARCNGSAEPRPSEDEYIRENPTCFYVFGHYLDRAAGWHKMPEELPAFDSWRLIDVVLFGKKTGTAWMEHEKWEAQYWAFRSIDDRRNAETTEVLAWKLSELENTQDLENVTLEELNKKITEKIGIKFEENPKYPGEYVAKIKGGYTLEFSFSTYMTEDGGDGKKVILLGWSNKKGEGGGSPGDSIEEAVDYFKKALRRIEEDKHKKRKKENEDGNN